MPDAAVVHSHDYAPVEQLRRSFDEWRGLREVYGYTQPRRRARDARARSAARSRPTCATCAPRAPVGPRLLGDGARSAGHHAPASPAPCSAPAPTACRPACAGACRWSAAPPSYPRPDNGPMTAVPPDRPAGDDARQAIDACSEPPADALAARRSSPTATSARASCCSASLTFPLRFTPLRHRLRLAAHGDREGAVARARPGIARHGRPVTVVIPTYGAARRPHRGGREHPARRPRRARCGSSSPTTAARRSTSRGCKAIKGVRADPRRRERRLRGQRQPRPARGRPAARRRAAQLRRRRAAAVARRPAAAPPTRARRRHRRAPSCCIPTGASSTPACTATSARRSGSTTATASSRRPRPGQRGRRRARRDRRVHVRQARR